MLAYLNGQFLPRAAAAVPVEDRGFVFGDGVYEVWRVVGGRLFETQRHLARLSSGLSELRIQAPELVDPDRLTAIADRLLTDDALLDGEATFYVEITRGVAPRTHQFPSGKIAPTVFAMANRFKPAEELRRSGATCITMPDVRWLRCDIKTIQLLPNVLGKQAAAEAGALDVLFVRDGVITETSHANVLAVIDGVIRTHPTNNLILPGVTRAVVLEIARDLRLQVDETPFLPRDLTRASEVFLAGTTTDVMPIVRVDDVVIGDGKPGSIATTLFRELRQRLDALAPTRSSRAAATASA
ncbi:MAG TPA: aminotransferase class IV [Gemmatimonadaceae bacterium]|nr:aminotransferase class IV [Gemmatimonadaceae bacterium]